VADRVTHGSDAWQRAALAEHGYDLEQPEARPVGASVEQVVEAYRGDALRLRDELADLRLRLRVALQLDKGASDGEIVTVAAAMMRAGR